MSRSQGTDIFGTAASYSQNEANGTASSICTDFCRGQMNLASAKSRC